MNDAENITLPTVSLSTVRDMFLRISAEFSMAYTCGQCLSQSRWLILLGRIQSIEEIASALADDEFIREVHFFRNELDGVRVVV